MEASPDATNALFDEKKRLTLFWSFSFLFQTQESLCSSRRLCDMMSSRFVFAFYCSDFAPSSVFLHFLLSSKRAKRKKKALQKEARMKKHLPGFSWGHSCGLNGFSLSLLRLEEAWGELRLFIGHISLPPEYEYVNLLLPITDHNCRRSRTFCRCSAWINKRYILNVRRVKAFHHFTLLLLLFTEGPGKGLNLGTVLNEKKFSEQQTLGRLLWTFQGQVHRGRDHHPLLPKVLPGGPRDIPRPGSTFSFFGISAEPGHCTDSSVAALACPNSVHHLWGSP